MLILVYAAGCILGAAVVRGYSGFGFSLLAITSISLFIPPAEIVPSIFLLEVAASLRLLPEVWRDVHWRVLMWLFWGCCLGTPFGVYALARLPEAPMTLALAVFVSLSTLLIARGYQMRRMPGPLATFATGTGAGLCNGGFGMGGPPVVLFFFSSPAGAAAGRASLIAYFLLTDIVGLAWQGGIGLISPKTFWLAAWCLPPLILGLRLGNRSFTQHDPATVRRWILRLLMLLAVLAGAKATSQLVHIGRLDLGSPHNVASAFSTPMT